MKETIEKQAVNYGALEFMQLFTLAKSGDVQAESELIAREAAQKAEIESLKIKANSKRKPAVEKTPVDLAKDNAYFRAALLVKQFGVDNVTLQTLTVASAYLQQGLAQGNLRQAFNRVSQVLNAQAVTETVFPEWILHAASEIPQLDENKKLEEETEKVDQIFAVISKYLEAPAPEAPAPEAPAPEAPAPEAPTKKGAKK